MIAVVSPHLDDGVLGCGARLAARPGSVVITVFAAGPSIWEGVTPWDAACGFAAGDDVIAARRAEDYAYEDALYRRLPGRIARKRLAVRCYQSRLRGLGTSGRLGHADAFAPERYWRLST